VIDIVILLGIAVALIVALVTRPRKDPP